MLLLNGITTFPPPPPSSTTMPPPRLLNNFTTQTHPDHQHRTHYISTEGGVFSGKSVLNSPLGLFLVQVTIIIVLSRLLHRCVLLPLRQPRVIAEIIGGICLGPSLLGMVPHFTETLFPAHSLPTLSLVSSFGLVLYMFLMGLELDTDILIKGFKRFTTISLAGIVLPGALGALVSYGLYEFLLEEEKRAVTPFSSFLLFTFVALAITAFPVLARILTEKKLLNTTVGMMTISAAAIDDICAWVLLALTISIINASNPWTALYVLATVALYALFLLVPGRILLRKAFERFCCRGTRRILTQFVLALIFVMVFLSAWTTEWIGVHAIFGAFLVGIIIPRVGGITMELTHKIEDLVGIAFLPLYFASSGLKTKMGLLNDWMTALFCLAVIVVACFGKIVGCTLAAKWTGFPWREALSIGVLMNTKGLVELIVLNIGLDAGVINDRIFVVMVVMALVTTFMTSPIIAWVYPPKWHQRLPPSSSSSALATSSSSAEAAMSKKRTKTAPKTEGFSEEGEVEDEQAEDKHILLFLQNIDSIPLVSNILQMIRLSLAPGAAMLLSGFKAFTDIERSSNIMVWTQQAFVIESDPTLRMFKFFGKLIGSQTRCFVTTTRQPEVGMEVERVATDQQCTLILVPWHTDGKEDDDQAVTVASILQYVRLNTVAIFVDRRPSGTGSMLHNATPPFDTIVVPFIGAGGVCDRAAFQLALWLRRQHGQMGGNNHKPGTATTDVRLVVLHLWHGNGNELDSELLREVRDLNIKEAGEQNFVFNFVNYGNDPTDVEGALNAALKTLSSPSGDESSHKLVILGYGIHPALLIAKRNKQQLEYGGSENNGGSMTPRLIRRFSQAAGFGSGCGMINEEERIFGSLGEIVYNTTTREKEGSSLMIVHHEPSLSTIIPSPLLSTMRLLNTPDGGVAKTADGAAV